MTLLSLPVHEVDFSVFGFAIFELPVEMEVVE
jgi:hypothetical protein